MPLLRPGAELNEDQNTFLGLRKGDAVFLEGAEHELSDYVFLSVPPDMPVEAVKRLQEGAVRVFGKPVVAVTHNLAFLRVDEVSEGAADRLIKQEIAEAQARKDKKREWLQQRLAESSGDGDRPGAGENGGGGGELRGNGDDGASSEVDRDKESIPERVEGDAGGGGRLTTDAGDLGSDSKPDGDVQPEGGSN